MYRVIKALSSLFMVRGYHPLQMSSINLLWLKKTPNTLAKKRENWVQMRGVAFACMIFPLVFDEIMETELDRSCAWGIISSPQTLMKKRQIFKKKYEANINHQAWSSDCKSSGNFRVSYQTLPDPQFFFGSLGKRYKSWQDWNHLSWVTEMELNKIK